MWLWDHLLFVGVFKSQSRQRELNLWANQAGFLSVTCVRMCCYEVILPRQPLLSQNLNQQDAKCSDKPDWKAAWAFVTFCLQVLMNTPTKGKEEVAAVGAAGASASLRFFSAPGCSTWQPNVSAGCGAVNRGMLMKKCSGWPRGGLTLCWITYTRGRCLGEQQYSAQWWTEILLWGALSKQYPTLNFFFAFFHPER